jgi:small basic protein (TIGR04137 family)
MSIHPSLRISDKDKKQRSVLKRAERIKTLMEKGEWKKGDRIYGLPKIKAIKIKIKKEKVEKAAEAVAAEGATPLTAATKEQAAATSKAAAPKAAAPKEKK